MVLLEVVAGLVFPDQAETLRPEVVALREPIMVQRAALTVAREATVLLFRVAAQAVVVVHRI